MGKSNDWNQYYGLDFDMLWVTIIYRVIMFFSIIIGAVLLLHKWLLIIRVLRLVEPHYNYHLAINNLILIIIQFNIIQQLWPGANKKLLSNSLFTSSILWPHCHSFSVTQIYELIERQAAALIYRHCFPTITLRQISMGGLLRGNRIKGKHPVLPTNCQETIESRKPIASRESMSKKKTKTNNHNSWARGGCFWVSKNLHQKCYFAKQFSDNAMMRSTHCVRVLTPSLLT
jgi:hypothetical protein